MSNSPETSIDLEALELHLLPAWARESADTKRYAHFEGGRDKPSFQGHDQRDRRDRRPPRDNRPARDSGKPRPGPRTSGGHGEAAARGSDRGFKGQRFERAEPAEILPEISVALTPDEKGVESIARQIKLSGRAYPVFDIAQLILRKADRYRVTFGVMKRPDGQVIQPLWLCNLDDSVWLAEQDAVAHVLRRHFETFYRADRTPADPPKGTYTFVAQCGLSGVVLGPPNYHDYQIKLRKLHGERFARMPFEVYKAKVRIVKDETVVKQWIEDQSWKIEYACLNVPDTTKLASREEVEKHFREVHSPNIVRAVESHTLTGAVAQQLASPPLRRLVRNAWEDQRRFPIKLVTTLSQQFASHGLQFFKVNKTVTHVSVARPHHLDLETTPVSDGVRRIVEFINARRNSTRKQLVETLEPARPVTTPAAGTDAIPSPGAIAVPASETVPAPAEPTPEQTALVADLHWLIHQGHVIEFANGRLETARKPLPKPQRKEPAPVALKAAQEIPQISLEPGCAPAGNSVAIPEASNPEVPAAITDLTVAPVVTVAAPESVPLETPAQQV